MQNREVAELLYTIAEFLEIKDIAFKPRAYQKAAQSIESLAEPIEELAKAGKLEEISGVGEHIAEKIEEYLETGHINYLDNLKKQTPIQVHELKTIEGMGPKTIKLLYQKLKIKNIKDLIKAAKAGKIRTIKSLGEKTEKNILENASIEKEERVVIGYILPEAEELKSILKNQKEITHIDIAGSLRRRKETIGDIDLLAVSNDPKKTAEFFTSLKFVKKVLAKGPKKCSVKLTSGMQVDLRLVEPHQWGAALLYFTGNKQHNIELRKICIAKGLKLNEYGIFKKEKQIAGKTEEEVYKTMGMQYIPPEMREHTGELALALKKKLPILVEQKDIKGDLHAHTNATDGANTIKEMGLAAQNIGYKYLAITDHTFDLTIGMGLNEKQLLKHAANIRKASKELDINLLAGAEVNIRKDGTLDIPLKTLKQLDIVLISIHSSFRQDKKTMTNRIVKAMDSGVAHIYCHPTARLIGSRNPITFDYQTIFDKAKEMNMALEIDGQPERMDLKDTDVRSAVEQKILIAANTDAHAVDQLHYMKYAVSNARRGWAEKKNILNTYTFKKLQQFLKK